MNKRILLVYPKIPTTYWSFRYALPFIGKKATMPPLGLLTVAALLPRDYEVKLVDMNTTALDGEEIDAADLVFISAMIVQKASFEEIVAVCRARNRTVVAGGPYPTCSFTSIQGVDHFVLDEAELTLPAFLHDYKKGCPQAVYRAPERPDLSSTPVPRFELIDPQEYDSMPLQFSRGCPFSCEFCDIIELFGRTPRTKLPEQFLMEMEAVYETGYRGSIFVVDDNFVGNRHKVKELLQKLVPWQREHGYPFSLYTEASVNLAQDDELLDLMVAARFDMVFVGIETPDREALALTHKTQNLRTDLLQSVEKIQRKGLEVAGGFIVGFDGEREDIFDRQYQFIQRAGIPMAMVGLLAAMPNTQLSRRLAKEGRLLDDARGNNTHNLHLNFVPQMNRERLIEGYKGLLARLYSPKIYFRRCLNLLQRLPAPCGPSKPVTGREVRIFLRSLFRQGFSSYGPVYLSFLLQTLWTRHGLFPVAVRMAIRGHHFFIMTQEILKAEAFSGMLNLIMESLQKGLAEAVRAGSRQRLAELEQRVAGLLVSVWKRYQQLSREVQHSVQDSLWSFLSACQSLLSRSRLACEP